MGNFLAPGQEIRNNLTESREPLYTNIAIQTNSNNSLEPPKAPKLLADNLTLANNSSYKSSNLISSTSSKLPIALYY